MTPDPLTTKSGAEIFAETLVGLVSALAWPLLVASVLFYFREPLKNLISRVKSASVAGNTIDFRDELQEVSKQIKEEVAEHKGDLSINTDDNSDAENNNNQDDQNAYDPLVMNSNAMNNLFAVASLSPASAVLESFKYVEDEWHALLKSRGIIHKTRGRYKNFYEAVGLPAEIVSNIDRMRQLRNKAAHAVDNNITPGDASNYVVSAFQLANLLRATRQKNNVEL